VSVETPVDEITHIIAADDQSLPVFVDASGRRGKRIRVVFGALGAVTLVYGALVAMSLIGGPLKPQQLLPFPELVNNLPMLEPQTPATKPGAKNTPAVNKPAVTSAKRLTNAGPAQSGAAAAPSATGDVPGAPAPTTATTPPVEGTGAAPTAQPSPSADPTRSAQPDPTGGPAGPPTSTPVGPGPEGTKETQVPAQPTVAASQSATTIPIGDTSTDTASAPATRTASAAPTGAGTGSTTSETGGSAASPSATASLSPA
jgi:hypothetical protein